MSKVKIELHIKADPDEEEHIKEQVQKYGYLIKEFMDKITQQKASNADSFTTQEDVNYWRGIFYKVLESDRLTRYLVLWVHGEITKEDFLKALMQ